MPVSRRRCLLGSFHPQSLAPRQEDKRLTTSYAAALGDCELWAGGAGGVVKGATAGTATAGAVSAASFCAMIWLAAAVPSRPQIGHVTLEGMRPLTGSTSNM